MSRQNYLSDEPWDELHDDVQIRTRVFARRREDTLTASLHQLLPRSPGFRLHMHYGGEEMFFVVSGTPVLRNGLTEEQFAPGDVVHCPEGRDGLHTFSNPGAEPARILALSAGGFPDVVAYPEDGVAWVATRNPEFPAPEHGDSGIVARFELPADDD
jgi:uncharacterized cupin superfamily protein